MPTLADRNKPTTRAKLTVCATYTADLIEEFLTYWLDRLGTNTNVALGPYNQVFQQLLDPNSLLLTNEAGLNILLIRLEDWLRFNGEKDKSTERAKEIIRDNVAELIKAVKSSSEQTDLPCLICITPNAPTPKTNELSDFYEEIEQCIVSRLKDTSSVSVITSKDIFSHYPDLNYFDSTTDQLGHVPYTPTYFAALSTIIARKFSTLNRQPYKVLVLDCDNTLWGGVCGEVGADNVDITGPYRELQEFVVSQQKKGMLICLSSKNSAEDVEAVFTTHPDMPLKKEHIVLSKVNWEAKSGNINDIAKTLNLSLDSFIFIDDNPVETAEVSAQHPAILSLCLPSDKNKFTSFLQNIWSFDHSDVTDTDEKRTILYQENIAREDSRSEASSFQHFIESLQLQVDIAPLDTALTERAAQLTQRTNQFNFTTIRRTTSEIHLICEGSDSHCLSVHVADRFGEYGFVGLMIFQTNNGVLNVDTFLLSCRVLGRGVEHKMLAALGTLATESNLSNVRLPFKPTQKNQPAYNFASGLNEASQQGDADNQYFSFESSELATLFYQPVKQAVSTTNVSQDAAQSGCGIGMSSLLASQIANELSDPEVLLESIQHCTISTRPLDAGKYVAPTNDVEEIIASLWQEFLGIDEVGIYDSFFNLGGNSLKAMQIIARLNQRFGISLSGVVLFDKPCVSDLATLFSNESASEAATPESGAKIMPMNQEKDIPLGYVQRRLWLFEQMEDAKGVYNIPYAFRIDGDFSSTAMEQALSLLTQRHGTLRTIFSMSGTTPVQLVLNDIELPLSHIDLSGDSDQKASLRALMADEAEYDFDIQKGPLWRCVLVTLSPNQTVMLLVFHHIIFDGWSIRVLGNDINKAYAAFLQGEEPSFDKLPIQYADYAMWQVESQSEELLQEQISYWVGQLKDAPPVLALPTDYTRPAVQQFKGDTQTLHISSQLHSQLKRLGSKSNASLFMVLLSAFDVLMSRYTNKQDFVVGSAIANRTPTETEGLIGLFMNTLALRCDLSGNPSFSELITRTRRTLMDAYRHQSLSFDRIVEEINPERNLSYSPVFQVMFIFDEAADSPVIQLPGTKSSQIDIHSQTSKFDITLYMWERSTGLEAILEYNTSLFSEATIQAMLSHYQVILEGAVNSPTTAVSALPLLPKQEIDSLLAYSKGPAIKLPENDCIHTIFEAQVEKTPHACALCFEDESLTYQEINERANQLSNYLLRQNVHVGDMVGIMVERSTDMVVAMMATLKVGAAYVPMDPAYPQERLRYMADDARLAMVITQQKYSSIVPDTKQVQLDVERVLINHESTAAISTRVPSSSHHIAYVIYTSGSTGKPKGVMVEHQNAANFFSGMDLQVGTDKPGVWLAVTSISFDISVLEILWTLCRGYKVVLYRDDDRKAGGARPVTRHPQKPMDFSFFYWNFLSEAVQKEKNKYRLLLDSAKYGDKNGFKAVWTPERHFGSFGALYPNPSVTSAAVAAITNNIELRAGSCVVPLHSPIRIAEEWAMVDNMSNGRVGIGVASGWQVNDFVIKPENHADAKNVMYEYVETVRKLWRGEKVKFDGPKGEVEVETFPRPIQKELPIWVTVAVNPETFRQAGELGANVLTHLLGQDIDKVAANIKIYREARKAAGYDGDGQVTLMLHTLVGEDEESVKNIARQPMKDYLLSAVFLVKAAAWDSPAWKLFSENSEKTLDDYFDTISDEDLDAILEFAFERYFSRSGLFGTAERCLALVDQLKEIGVDEIGCLIDYGIDTDTVLKHLPALNEVRELSNTKVIADYSIPALIKRHAVTHFQCTPTMASMLAADEQTHDALNQLSCMMIGGEAFPSALAKQLNHLVGGRVINMYGPTETTIWSSTYTLDNWEGSVPLGNAIVNTQIYIMDQFQQLLPYGVPGELVIAGDGVVRGYLNRPELTDEHFVSVTIADTDPQRMYRTGDLARRKPDGTLEFLGRIDHQVKILGFRIELGEVETVIQNFNDVKDAIVIPWQDASGAYSLVGYIISSDESSPCCVNALKDHVRVALPEYMVPSLFVHLTEFPLTPNGKIDRKAFPSPDQPKSASKEAYVAPTSDLEKIIANIWKDVLGRDQVGVNENFFDLGGHSLLVIQALTRLRQEVDPNIQITLLFQHTTISSLTKHLQTNETQTPSNTGQNRAQARKTMSARRRRGGKPRNPK